MGHVAKTQFSELFELNQKIRQKLERFEHRSEQNSNVSDLIEISTELQHLSQMNRMLAQGLRHTARKQAQAVQ